MSNEFVQASVNFLNESWYRENAGTPEYQEAKYLEQAFDDIVEYCVENGLDIEESIEIASEIIEDDLVEEFYEEILSEDEISAVQRSRDLARQRSQQAQQAQRANQEKQANRALQGGKAVNITGTGMFGSQYLQGTARLNSGATKRLGRSVLNVTPTAITGRSGRSTLPLDNKTILGGKTYYRSQLGGKDIYISGQQKNSTNANPKLNLPSWVNPNKPANPPDQNKGSTTSTPTPTRGSTTSTPTPTRGSTTPTAPTAGRSPVAPTSTASALTRTSTASTRPIVPTAPAAPSPPTLAKLGQGSGDSIFNREGGRQEYERRMKQAIRTGTKYQPASTGVRVGETPQLG